MLVFSGRINRWLNTSLKTNKTPQSPSEKSSLQPTDLHENHNPRELFLKLAFCTGKANKAYRVTFDQSYAVSLFTLSLLS